MPEGAYGINNNQSKLVLDRWQKPGDLSKFAKFTTIPDLSYSYAASSDGTLSDGSYIRLRNIAITYMVPKHLGWIGLPGMKVIFKCDNLITITSYDGIDPEVTAFGAVPTQKYFSLGIQLSL
jgi:TonB-dependent starch-binding outer membrane protein SusC